MRSRFNAAPRATSGGGRRAICGRCSSFEWAWHEIEPTGLVNTWITTHHVFLPSYPTPYHSVLVRLDLGDGSDQGDILIPGRWEHHEPPRSGERVVGGFRDIRANDAVATLLTWQPSVSE